MRFTSLIAGLLLTGCAASDLAAIDRDVTDGSASIWRFDDHVDTIRDLSCPEGVSYRSAQPLQITAKDIAAEAATSPSAYMSGISIGGAWHLTSDNEEFGGLSGIAILPSGTLLAVSDDGKFIEIGLDAGTATPDGTGSLAFLRDTDGQIFPNKRAADAEGLVVEGGIALVSFEQDHRVHAYDLGQCGAAAHAVEVVKLDKVVGGNVLRPNGGAEALALAGESLVAGFEVHQSTGSPYGEVREDGTLSNFARTVQPGTYVLTGMDIVGDLTARVFRAYDPARGPRAIDRVLKGTEPKRN